MVNRAHYVQTSKDKKWVNFGTNDTVGYRVAYRLSLFGLIAEFESQGSQVYPNLFWSVLQNSFELGLSKKSLIYVYMTVFSLFPNFTCVAAPLSLVVYQVKSVAG